MNCNFKIKEIRELSILINKHYKIDISDFTYVILKIKFEQFCNLNKISSATHLIEKIESSVSVFKELVVFLFANEFELFRDPALWRSLKQEVLNTFTRDIQYRVLIPSSFGGADLISFLILREELSLTDKIQVIYTSPIEILNKVKDGFLLEERKHNLNLSNYKRIDGDVLKDSFFKKELNMLYPVEHLFKNTVYAVFSEIQDGRFHKNVNLILYRNKLISYNRKLQIEVINNLINSLKTGGFLALGVKERLIDDANREKFIIFNKKESLYKKH